MDHKFIRIRIRLKKRLKKYSTITQLTDFPLITFFICNELQLAKMIVLDNSSISYKKKLQRGYVYKQWLNAVFKIKLRYQCTCTCILKTHFALWFVYIGNPMENAAKKPLTIDLQCTNCITLIYKNSSKWTNKIDAYAYVCAVDVDKHFFLKSINFQ